MLQTHDQIMIGHQGSEEVDRNDDDATGNDAGAGAECEGDDDAAGNDAEKDDDAAKNDAEAGAESEGEDEGASEV